MHNCKYFLTLDKENTPTVGVNDVGMKKDIYKMKNPYLGRFWIIFFLLILLAYSNNGLAQNITETRWYFGASSENLIFDLNGREVYLQDDQATPFGNAGAVTITDQFTGNLLFYTDGELVYDFSHTVLPSAVPLSGNSSINVPVVSCPVPGNPGQYYLFTNSGSGGVNEIQYAVVDATLAGNGSDQFPYGDMVQSNESTGLINPSEGMILIPLGDGDRFWLITQDRTSFDISVSSIDDTGMSVDSVYTFVNVFSPGFEASHFAYYRDSAKLAMVPKTANRNMWLMDFSPTSGILALDTVLVGTGFNDGASESVYDVEWSANGKKLYLSRYGGAGTTGQVFQIDFVDSTSTGQLEPILPNPVFRSYGLKRAIDSRIYHLYQELDSNSPFTLGRINFPDSVADSVVYQPIAFPEDFNSTQFSEFSPAYNFTMDTLDFYWIDSCATNITKFFPVVDPVPNTLQWSFGPAGGSTAWVPNFEFPGAGTYDVILTAEIGGIIKQTVKGVSILTNDLMVDLGNDTTICIDEVLTLDAGQGESFVWSTGEITQTIDVDTTGTYWVEVTNAAGCTDFDDIEVLEYGVSEQIYNQWYFGEQAGIDFNNGSMAILDGNNQDAMEGCATISDVNGDLLFYTNGVTVWNRNHEVMLNGDSIGGDAGSAQNSLIMPFNGDETMYYIFTTEQVYGDDEYALKYSIVDMKEDVSLGKVVMKNAKLMDNSTERVTGSGFTGSDLIVVHEFGNNTFRTYQTGANGLNSAIFSPGGETHEFMDELSATGYMKISPTFNQIAVLIPGTGQVEILDFSQGEVSNPRLIDTGEQDLYGLEFSPGATKLYLTTSSANSKLIQYDLDSLNSADPEADIEATKFDGYTQGANYGALQIGPDGVIYMAVDNAGSIGNITAPEGDDGSNGFNPSGFNLQGRTSRLGLPNFAQVENTPFQEPSITVIPGCVGMESTFSAVGRDPNNSIEEYLWVFGDGNSAPVQDTTHIYNTPGTYNVQMVLSNRCDTDTILTATITIDVIPELPTVPTDTALCDQPVVLEAWPVDEPNFTYQWSTGETTRQITVSEPAIIDVTITDLSTGCPSSTVTVFVADQRPDVDLGSDQSYCQNDPPVTLDAQIANASSYLWTIDGTATGTNRTLDVSTSVAGQFEYILEVRNSFGCVGRDTLMVTILEAPNVTSIGQATTGCGNDDGYLDITFNSTGSFVYEISGPASRGPFNFDGPGNVTIPLGSAAPGDGDLPPGNYNLVVTNLVTGCSLSEVVQIEDPGMLGMQASAPNACIGDGEINITFSGTTPANFDVSIVDQSGSNVLNTNLSSPHTNPVVQNLDTGTYFIQVTEVGGLGCVETDTVRIQLLAPQPDFTFDAIQEICGVEGTIFVMDGTGGSTTYMWTGPGIVGTANNDSITVNQPGTYTVTAGDGITFCPRSENIEVIFNADPVVQIDVQGDPCEGEVTLVANVTSGSGTYIFNWSDGSQAQQNVVSTTGNYIVTVTDQFTGCESSANTDITIEEEFDLQISLEPDCENNGQVFVIATTNYYHPSISYQWQDGSGNILAASDSVITVSVSDTYQVTATNETGTCVITEQASVMVIPIEAEDLILPDRTTFCRDDVERPTASLDAGIFSTYEWRLIPDTTILSTDQVYQATQAGTYEVTIYNGFTCTTDQVQVVEDCRPIVYAPNAFSPNGNGINEEFFVFPNDFVDRFEILIYTRWGELVFRSQSQDFRWDGVYRGQLLPPGTYAYIMKFSSSLDPALGTIEQYGSITLVR